ncbi:MAG: hypothetical protein PHH41_07555 [Sulfurimonas sp.]|nr:hypothetical protein [Sulfurimonas sp.]MDD5202977.1 hypothetical protein [Sulfurimonas sp.]
MEINSSQQMMQMQHQYMKGQGGGNGMRDLMQSLSSEDASALKEQMASLSSSDKKALKEQIATLDLTTLSSTDLAQSISSFLSSLQSSEVSTAPSSLSFYA